MSEGPDRVEQPGERLHHSSCLFYFLVPVCLRITARKVVKKDPGVCKHCFLTVVAHATARELGNGR